MVPDEDEEIYTCMRCDGVVRSPDDDFCDACFERDVERQNEEARMAKYSMFDISFDHQCRPFATPIIESLAATSLPKLKEPRTDDMRAMVDDLLVRIPPERLPVMLMVDGKIIVHPTLMPEIRRQVGERMVQRANQEYRDVFRASIFQS